MLTAQSLTTSSLAACAFVYIPSPPLLYFFSQTTNFQTNLRTQNRNKVSRAPHAVRGIADRPGVAMASTTSNSIPESISKTAQDAATYVSETVQRMFAKPENAFSKTYVLARA